MTIRAYGDIIFISILHHQSGTRQADRKSSLSRGGGRVFVILFKSQQFLYMISKEKDKLKQAREIGNELLGRIKRMFVQHGKKVHQLNQERNFGNQGNKNEKSDQLYNNLEGLLQEIKNLQNKIIANEKPPKLKKDYKKPLANCRASLEELVKKKNIKIQANDHLITLIKQYKSAIKSAQRNLGGQLKTNCCGANSTNQISIASLQSSMIQIRECCYFWSNLSKLQSISNSSNKQIYLPVQYDQTQFKQIHNEIQRLIPEPQVVEIQRNVMISQSNEVRKATELLFGFTRPRQINLALELFRIEAQKESCDAGALNALGFLHQQGKWVPKDSKKSVEYYLRSAQMNDAEGLYRIGIFLEKGIIDSKKYFEGMYPNRSAEIRGGMERYQKAAKMGHLDAITDLGYIYEKGIQKEDGGYYIDPNPEFAMQYYILAKKRDFPRALNNLGGLYIKQNSIAQKVVGSHLQKGIEYLKRSAKLKYPRAFVNLGKCYENGVGVAVNIQYAKSLFLQGSDLGDVQSKLQYVKLCLNKRFQNEDILIKLHEIVREVLSVCKDNPQALYFLGLLYEKGIGVQANPSCAFYYVKEAARMGHPSAFTKLGDYYYSGYCIGKDIEMARQLYEKAAEKNNSQALLNLGIMTQKGEIKENKPSAANNYFETASRMGNANAYLLMEIDEKVSSTQHSNLRRAAELGSFDAVKMLSKTGSSFLPPKKDKHAKDYENTLKQLNSVNVQASQTNFRTRVNRSIM